MNHSKYVPEEEMKTRTALTALLLTLGIAAPGPSAWAVGTEGNPDGASYSTPPIARLIMGNIGRFLVLRSELNITDQQRQQIRGAVKRHRDEIRPVAQTILEKKRALREAVLTKPGDEEAIRKAASELGKAIGDASVVASKVVAGAKGSLKPEQVERIRQFRVGVDKAETEWLEHMGR
jgi:Spy/CpxP family protein refolding chaperone